MGAADKFPGGGITRDPGFHAASVTPSDSNELTNASRALYVGGDGDLRVKMAGGETVTFSGVVAGTLLPFRVRQVFSTSTTATNIVAVW